MKLLLSFFLIILASKLAHAKSWQLRYSFENIRSDSNFNSNGDETALSSSNNLNAWVQDVQLRYKNNNAWRYTLGLGFNYVSSFTSDYERSNIRLSDLRGGVDYILHKKWGKLSFGSEVKIATFKVDTNTDEALVSSGSNEILAYSRYHNSFWNRLGVMVQLGYIYRDVGLSDLGTSKFELQILSMPMVLGLGVESIQSVSDDEFTNSSATRTNVTDRVNGGSYEFYSVNPNKTSAYAWISYSFSPRLMTQLGIKKSISGSNTSNSSNIFFSLYYSFQDFSYANEDLGISSYTVNEHGEFQVVVDKDSSEDLFNERGDRPKVKVDKEKIRRKKRREKISDPDYEF